MEYSQNRLQIQGNKISPSESKIQEITLFLRIESFLGILYLPLVFQGLFREFFSEVYIAPRDIEAVLGET